MEKVKEFFVKYKVPAIVVGVIVVIAIVWKVAKRK